jgi:hypothetical protein
LIIEIKCNFIRKLPTLDAFSHLIVLVVSFLNEDDKEWAVKHHGKGEMRGFLVAFEVFPSFQSAFHKSRFEIIYLPSHF